MLCAEITPVNIAFETSLNLNEITSRFQTPTAMKILHSMFYIALCIGAINVIRVFVFYPDKAKKVVTNYVVGIIVYSVATSFLGF